AVAVEDRRVDDRFQGTFVEHVRSPLSWSATPTCGRDPDITPPRPRWLPSGKSHPFGGTHVHCRRQKRPGPRRSSSDGAPAPIPPESGFDHHGRNMTMLLNTHLFS